MAYLKHQELNLKKALADFEEKDVIQAAFIIQMLTVGRVCRNFVLFMQPDFLKVFKKVKHFTTFFA